MEMNIYPAPQKVIAKGGQVRLNGCVSADEHSAFALEPFIHAVHRTNLTTGDGNVKLIFDPAMNKEAYEIHADETIEIKAASTAGFVFAASTLSQMISDEGTVARADIFDEPYKPVRGVHMYLPPCDGIDEFCRILDSLAYLKYNTLFLEIGGGVEYEKHPEINDAWRRFCREARDFPAGPQGLQASQEYWKDSTHVELAGGGVLTKQQLKRIVGHARSLGMEVIPEIQAMSHAYYLTLAHREIAERPYEPWPDTYCPLNEDSYRLYFDVADEIYETIGFDRVSIGHDEIRIISQCPRCKDHPAHELLAYEINRLHEYYAAKGVEVWMWGEKLQNFMTYRGTLAGAVVDKTDRFGRRWYIPETYQAIDQIPRDIVMLDWQYSNSPYSEKEFEDRGIREIYGNFKGSTIANWPERSSRKNVLGGEVSTWCVTDENEIGRNGWFTEFAFSAAVLWQNDYGDDQRDLFHKRSAAVLADIRSIVRGERVGSKPCGTLLTPSVPDGSCVSTNAELRFSGYLPDNAVLPYGSSHSTPEIAVNRKCDRITFLHAADFGTTALPKRIFTWYFLDKSPYICAHYVIEYADGVITAVPIEFGVQTGALASDFSWHYPQSYEKRFDDETQLEENNPVDFSAPYCEMNDPWLDAAIYFSDACPVELDGKKSTIYAWNCKNPRPDVEIRKITLYAHSETSVPLRLFGCIV